MRDILDGEWVWIETEEDFANEVPLFGKYSGPKYYWKLEYEIINVHFGGQSYIIELLSPSELMEELQPIRAKIHHLFDEALWKVITVKTNDY